MTETKSLTELNAEIRTVLESHRLDWHTFATLDPRSYEQQLAQHSPQLLNEFYSVLFAPGLSHTQRLAQCPPWPPGSPTPGKQIDIGTLYRIERRWNAICALDSVSEIGAIVEKFRSKLGKLPAAQADNVTDLLCSILSQELLAAKLEGVNLRDQTKALAQLLRKQKLGLDEKSLDLTREKHEFDATAACMKELPKLKEVSNKPKMSEEEKRRIIQEILFPKRYAQ